MKLVLAIVHDDDANRVMDELNTNGFPVTKLCSTGGFLKSGNTTLLIGMEKSKVELAIEIIKKMSKSRKQIIQTPAPAGTLAGVYVHAPVEVTVGGATLFVMDVERFEKA